VCKDNSLIHGKCRQRFFYPTYVYNGFFLHVFFTFLTFFYVHLNVYYIYGVVFNDLRMAVADSRYFAVVVAYGDNVGLA